MNHALSDAMGSRSLFEFALGAAKRTASEAARAGERHKGAESKPGRSGEGAYQ
jgi:hypothetical protein